MIPSLPVRLAESSRIASCDFADKVARLSVETYLAICPPDVADSYRQTVLASFLLLDESSSGVSTSALQVVSLGVGTKYLLPELLVRDRVCRDRTRIKDSHAEVLAKRGFHLFLLQECQKAILSTSRYVCLTDNGRFALRDCISIHFYSSSAPCGNACIKKWARGRKPKKVTDLGEYCFPKVEHPQFHVTARREGQVALLLKRSSVDTDAEKFDDCDEKEQVEYCESLFEVKRAVASEDVFVDTPGTSTLVEGRGYIMSCSGEFSFIMLRNYFILMCYLIIQTKLQNGIA